MLIDKKIEYLKFKFDKTTNGKKYLEQKNKKEIFTQYRKCKFRTYIRIVTMYDSCFENFQDERQTTSDSTSITGRLESIKDNTLSKMMLGIHVQAAVTAKLVSRISHSRRII